MHKVNLSQLGRSMLEMLAVVCLMALISIGIYEAYRFVVDKATSQTINQELNTRLIQIRHQALTGKGIQDETAEQALKRALSNKGGSGLPIQVQTGKGEFTLIVGMSEYPLELSICQDILNDYEANKHQCFVSGVCDEENGIGKLKFSNLCDTFSQKETDDYDCGKNAHYTGYSCVCNNGYENWKDGVGCKEASISCGSNAYQSGTECVCDNGYENWMSGKGCSLIELDCGANAHQSGAECVCDEGYENWKEGVGCRGDQEEKCPNGNVFDVSKEFCNSCPSAYPCWIESGGCCSCRQIESVTFTDRADAENCVRNCLGTWEKEIIEKTDESGNTVYECSSLECLRYHYFETQAEAENYKNYCTNLGYKMYVMETPSSYAAVPLGKNT